MKNPARKYREKGTDFTWVPCTRVFSDEGRTTGAKLRGNVGSRRGKNLAKIQRCAPCWRDSLRCLDETRIRLFLNIRNYSTRFLPEAIFLRRQKKWARGLPFPEPVRRKIFRSVPRVARRSIFKVVENRRRDENGPTLGKSRGAAPSSTGSAPLPAPRQTRRLLEKKYRGLREGSAGPEGRTDGKAKK